MSSSLESKAKVNSAVVTESQALPLSTTARDSSFFREFVHFEFLLNSALGPIVQSARHRADKTIRIWSAACGCGQEAYSLAMFLSFHLAHLAPDLKFEIWGTDADRGSIAHAKNGVYRTEELKGSPAMYLEGNWIRGKNAVKEFSKVKDELKDICRFETLDLLNSRSALEGKNFDLIFCRNVLSSFEMSQMQDIAQTLLKSLTPTGFLILGMSESLSRLSLPVAAVGPSIYRATHVTKVREGEARSRQERATTTSSARAS